MATSKRITRTITDQALIDSVIGIKPEDITSTYVVELFGEFEGKVRANPYDLITVPKGAYGLTDSKRGVNIRPFTTTVGKLIWNKMYILRNPSIYEAIGWVDDIVSKKVFNKLYKKLGYLLLEGTIDKAEFKRFAMTTQLTMPYVQFLSNSFTDTMLLSSTVMNKKKAELIKANKAAFDAKDIKVVDRVSKELMDYSKEYLKDDPGMDMFNSGGGGDFSNHYKNTYLMKGVVRNPDPLKGYDVITSNYIDGVSEEEYAALANTLAEGPFNRSKKTEQGGYFEKMLLYSMQHLQLLEPGSDCGTKRYIEIHLTDANIDDVMYNYIIQGDKLVEITSENRDSLIGKTVKMRFSSMCEAKDGCFCNKCAGNLWYRLGMTKTGVLTPNIASRYKNLMMKSFHDSQVKLTDMNVMEVFCPDEVSTT